MAACKKLSIMMFTILLTACCSGCSQDKNKALDTPEQSSEQQVDAALPDYVTPVKDSTKNESPKSYFQISDRYDMEGNLTLKDFYEQPGCIQKLHTFHKLLQENFEYMEFYEQPVQAMEYLDNPMDFVQSNDAEMANQSATDENGKEIYVTTLKTIEIGQTLNQQLEGVISDGRCFNSQDFIYQNNHSLPVILGSGYQELYRIGDILDLYYISDTFHFEVVGFFPPEYSLQLNNVSYNLNHFICLPFFDIEDIESCDLDKEFLLSYYIEKNSYYIAFPTDSEEEKIKQMNMIPLLAEESGVAFGANESIYTPFTFSATNAE